MPPLSRAARVWLPHHRTRPLRGLRAGGGSGCYAAQWVIAGLARLSVVLMVAEADRGGC